MSTAEILRITLALCRHHGCTCTPAATISTPPRCTCGRHVDVRVIHQPHCAPVARAN